MQSGKLLFNINNYYYKR